MCTVPTNPPCESWVIFARDHVFMWFADIYCDLDWVSSREGVLGPKRFALRGPKSLALGIDTEVCFFGDEHSLRHVRVLMHTDDHRTADQCVDLNVHHWVASLESAVMLETGRPFHIAGSPYPDKTMVVLASGDENSPATVMRMTETPTGLLDYRHLALGMAWPLELQQHLFYFRRLIDPSLPLDVRWLNGYRLLEGYFLRGKTKKDLPKDPDWKTFVAGFQDRVKAVMPLRRNPVGYLEEARVLAAHAGKDDRPPEEREREPRNPMQKTFELLHFMATRVLNEQFAKAGSPIKLQPRT